MNNPNICSAILHCKIIEFDYGGYHRIVEPHCYGSSKRNNPVIRAYQIGGGSKSGNIPSWRLFKREKMSNEVITNQIFGGPRPGYRKGDKDMTLIYCEL
ncbi:MAG TPA: hypothetical protein VKA34_00265 [Balneolales bacterium]|nr:hypothetical protein [Balneolales bacterium]